MPSVNRNAGTAATATNLTGLNATTGLTVAFWLKNFGQGGGDIIRHASTANNARDGYAVCFTSTELNPRIYGAAAGGSFVAMTNSPHRRGQWVHFAFTFDDATNQMLGYRDGKLVQVTTVTTDMTANASCTTTLAPGIVGTLTALLFDLQILPDVVVPPQDIPLLMDPRVKYPGIKARYFGLEFRSIGGSTVLRDESGNGNNLTTTAGAVLSQAEEPPWRQVFG